MDPKIPSAHGPKKWYAVYSYSLLLYVRLRLSVNLLPSVRCARDFEGK